MSASSSPPSLDGHQLTVNDTIDKWIAYGKETYGDDAHTDAEWKVWAVQERERNEVKSERQEEEKLRAWAAPAASMYDINVKLVMDGDGAVGKTTCASKAWSRERMWTHNTPAQVSPRFMWSGRCHLPAKI